MSSKPLANPKWEAFAQARSMGKSQIEAYVSVGYAPGAPKSRASQLDNKPEIRDRIANLLQTKANIQVEATAKAVEETGISKAWVLKHLAENVEMGKSAKPVLDAQGNPVGEYRQDLGAANKALELIGKELGMFIDRKEIRTGPLDDVSHEEKLRALDVVRQAIAKAKAVS